MRGGPRAFVLQITCRSPPRFSTSRKNVTTETPYMAPLPVTGAPYMVNDVGILVFTPARGASWGEGGYPVFTLTWRYSRARQRYFHSKFYCAACALAWIFPYHSVLEPQWIRADSSICVLVVWLYVCINNQYCWVRTASFPIICVRLRFPLTPSGLQGDNYHIY